MSQMRSLFVTHRMDYPDVPGPSNEAAAQQMGNTERQWIQTYYKVAKRQRLQEENSRGSNEYHLSLPDRSS
jgi:hypothetical protein